MAGAELLGLCEEVAGKRKGRIFFPWVAGIFIVTLLANLWEVIPGVETIGMINHEIPGCATCRIRRPLSGRQAILQLHHTVAAATLDRPELHLAIAIVSVDRHADLRLQLCLVCVAQLGRYLTSARGPHRPLRRPARSRP